MQVSSSASTHLIQQRPVPTWVVFLKLMAIVPLFALYMTGRAWQGLGIAIYYRFWAVESR